MSARSTACFLEILELDQYPLYKHKSRRSQAFVPTPQKHGRPVWVDVEGILLPYLLHYREKKFLRLNRNAILEDMNSFFPEIGGWTP